MGGTVIFQLGIESAQHCRQTEALSSDARAGNRHHQRPDDASSGSGGFGKVGGAMVWWLATVKPEVEQQATARGDGAGSIGRGVCHHPTGCPWGCPQTPEQ